MAADIKTAIHDLAARVATQFKTLLAAQNSWADVQSYAAGRVALTNATQNRIDWNTNGLAAPATNATPSAGTKLLLYPFGSSANVLNDFAIGVEANAMWFAAGGASATYGFKWYLGGAARMVLDGTGSLVVTGTLQVNSVTLAPSYRNNVATRTAAVSFGSTTPATNLCDATNGAFAVTLYAQATLPGQRFLIKKIDSSANAVTVTVASSGTIDGQTSIVLSSRYDWIEVESTATAGVWTMIGGNVFPNLALSGNLTVGNVGTFSNTVRINGASKLGNTRQVNANATQAGTDKYVELTASGITFTMIAATSQAGYDFYITNTSSAACTLSGASGTDTIGNSSSATQNISVPAGSTLHIVSIGGKWRLL